jgi:RsiW-degrading membrane proteinase PrsW (M82 family)
MPRPGPQPAPARLPDPAPFAAQLAGSAVPGADRRAADALVALGTSLDATTFDYVAWIVAAYFAIAWLLLLGVIVRPEHVTKPMLVLVTAIALATQVPLAVTLEPALHDSTADLSPSIYTVGLPEELAKAIPVLAVALIYWRRRDLTPRGYLFLGAVSGLAFGASEVVHYFTVNGV